MLRRIALAAISAGLAELPQNQHAWTYTINGFDGSPYLTRSILPRIAGHRIVLHRIHREDRDPHLHNHPWATARFLIVSGGYVEERLMHNKMSIVTRAFKPGDVNHIDAATFHRISYVSPNTWTIGLLGDRVQDWGFLVDGDLVPWREFFASKEHVQQGTSLS